MKLTKLTWAMTPDYYALASARMKAIGSLGLTCGGLGGGFQNDPM